MNETLSLPANHSRLLNVGLLFIFFPLRMGHRLTQMTLIQNRSWPGSVLLPLQEGCQSFKDGVDIRFADNPSHVAYAEYAIS